MASDVLCAFCGHGKEVQNICGRLYIEKVETEHLAAHKKCMQYSSGLDQNKDKHFGGFYIEDVQNEIKRGKRLKCFWCKHKKRIRPMTSATCGCELKGCRRSFHFYCAHQHPQSKTCRRRHLLTREDLYWVFCSDKHREEYLKTDQGKKEESCSETEDDDEAEDQEYVQEERVDTVQQQTDSEDSEESDSETSAQLYSESSSDGSESDLSSGSFGTNLSFLIPSVTPRKDASPSTKADPLNSSVVSESADKKKKQMKRQATDDKTKHHDLSHSKRKKENSKRKKSQQWKSKSVSKSRKRITSSDKSGKNRKQITSSNELEDDSRQHSAPGKAQTTFLSKLAGLGKTKHGRATTPERNHSQKHQDLPSPRYESLFHDSPKSSDSAGDSSVHHVPESSGDTGTHAMTFRTQAIFGDDLDTGDVDEEKQETELSENGDLGPFAHSPVQDSTECLLVIPEDYSAFEGVKEKIQKKLANDFGIRVQHVHMWDTLHPWDLLPSDCYLDYFKHLAKAVKKKNWEDMEDLLLDGSVAHERLKTDHMKEKAGRSCGDETRGLFKEALRKLIKVILTRACQRNEYMMGIFSHRFDVYYICFFINNICDPKQNVRCALHHSRIHPLDAGPVRLPSFRAWPSSHLHHYMRLEFEILKNWFRQKFPQDSYRVICVPEEQIFRLGPGENHAVFDRLKSELDAHSSYASGVPVIVFICRIKTSLIHFENYLQACLSCYTRCSSKLHVACVFPVDNLKGKRKCPQLEVDIPECSVQFFSAFHPSQKPVSLLVVEVRRQVEGN